MYIERSHPAWLFVFSLMLAAVLYLPVMDNFFLYDDLSELSHSSPLAGNGLANLLEPMNNGFWRPTGRIVSYAMVSLFGYAPLAFHALNILLHSLAAICVAELAKSLGLSQRIQTLSALIFLCNFAAWGAVSMYMNLADILFTLFILLSLLAFDKSLSGKPWFAFLSIAFFLLALGSKEVAVATPLLLLLWAYAKKGGGAIPATMGCIALGHFVVLLLLQQTAETSYTGMGRVSLGPINFVRQQLDYFLSSFFPWVHLYEFPLGRVHLDHAALWVIRGLLGMGLLVLVSVLCIAKEKVSLLLLSFAFILLAFASLLTTAPTPRYLYSALPFLSILIAYWVMKGSRKKALLAGVVMIGFLHVISFYHSGSVRKYEHVSDNVETFMSEIRMECRDWNNVSHVAIFNHPHPGEPPWRWAYAQQLFNLFLPHEDVEVQLDCRSEETDQSYVFVQGELLKTHPSEGSEVQAIRE